MSTYLDVILDLFFPPRCMLCNSFVDSSDTVVCPTCLLSDLPEVEGDPPKVSYFEKSAATFWYREPVIGAILQFKFHAVTAYGAQLGIWLSGTVKDKLEGRYDLISWVPCSKKRMRARGFDQAEFLAKVVAKELGTEAVRTLVKVKHNQKQSKTKDPAKRRANVLGVYRPYQPERFQGKRILLIDNVLTTGATLSECGKTLLLAGSGELVCAVIAAAHSDHNK